MTQAPRCSWLTSLSLTALLAGAFLPMPQALAGAVHARKGNITLPTYPWWPAVPHPYFQETDGKNIYPYPMLDNLSREKTQRTYATVELENDYLRITFLPELGGKIFEVTDKTTGQPMFYVNHVVKPGLIGMCGAWTSGGVEWNTGPQGHTVSAMMPVPVVILPPEPDGSQSVAVGETERIYGTRWTVVVTLRPDRSYIEERIRIYNPTATVRPYYFWNCTAAPNTPGFRFVYPMTLGTDHGSEKFFNWPVDHGKDLSRGTSYQDASSIFAWHCDQDFFGSYDDGADRGVVSYANHHQVPGKKAWTWGQGGFGKMHQRDLTDDDGPYNEVQTGPLLTQGEVGRLDPCEAVEWQEWWYPVHGIGDFTFANRELAARATLNGRQLQLRLIGTGSWNPVEVELVTTNGHPAKLASCRLSPRAPASLDISLPEHAQAPEIAVVAEGKKLAQFRVPLELPTRHPPEPKAKPTSADELAQAGWGDFMFGRFKDAEKRFREALEKDPHSTVAHTGLALLDVERDPIAAQHEADAALQTNPDCGLASLAWAVAAMDQDRAGSLDHAWQASLDPKVAVAARALTAKLLIQRGDFQRASAALSEPGAWNDDPVCRNRLAFAQWKLGKTKETIELARASLRADPLDAFAHSLLWLARVRNGSEVHELLDGNAAAVLDAAAQFTELGQNSLALQVIREFYLQQARPASRNLIVAYWAEALGGDAPQPPNPEPQESRDDLLFPWGPESARLFHQLVAEHPQDGRAALLYGDLLFQQRRFAEGKQMWQRAADLGANRAIAYRALGMASLNLDGDPAAAAGHLKRAHAADPHDAIVARDFARVLLAQADKASSSDQKNALWAEARDVLRRAFAQGKGRSDYVCLLAETQNRLGEYEETAKLLDSVRITVWEGSHEAHDLFEAAHLALGKADLSAGHPERALAEFNRALEYPANLAIGRLEHANEAPIHRLRAEAFTALGQTDAAREASRLAGDTPKSP